MIDTTKQLKLSHEWVMVGGKKVIAVDKDTAGGWVNYIHQLTISHYFKGYGYEVEYADEWQPIPKPRHMTQLEAWAKLGEYFKKGIVPSIKRKKGGYWSPAFGYNLACPEELEYKIPGDETIYQFKVEA